MILPATPDTLKYLRKSCADARKLLRRQRCPFGPLCGLCPAVRDPRIGLTTMTALLRR